VGPLLSAELEKIKKRSRSPCHKSDGTVDYVALTSFLNQINTLLGHPRKPFRPIEDDRSLL
jgi:hypothetical protein